MRCRQPVTRWRGGLPAVRNVGAFWDSTIVTLSGAARSVRYWEKASMDNAIVPSRSRSPPKTPHMPVVNIDYGVLQVPSVALSEMGPKASMARCHTGHRLSVCTEDEDHVGAWAASECRDSP